MSQTKTKCLRIALMVIYCVSLSLNIAAVAFHVVDSLTNLQANYQCLETSDSYFLQKFQSGTATIAFVMNIIGLSFSAILAVILLIILLYKGEKTPLAGKKFRIVGFLLTSFALIGTYTSFGYYFSYFIDGIYCNPTISDYLKFLPLLILTGVSTVLLLIALILLFFLPKDQEYKYQDKSEHKSRVQIEMQAKQLPDDSQHINVVLNGSQPIGKFKVKKNQQQNLYTEEANTNLNNPLLNKNSQVKPQQAEVINPLYGYQDEVKYNHSQENYQQYSPKKPQNIFSYSQEDETPQIPKTKQNSNRNDFNSSRRLKLERFDEPKPSSPMSKNSAYNQQPYKEDIYKQERPYKGQSAYRQQNPYKQQSPYRQQTPYQQDTPYKQQTPYKQYTPSRQQNPSNIYPALNGRTTPKKPPYENPLNPFLQYNITPEQNPPQDRNPGYQTPGAGRLRSAIAKKEIYSRLETQNKSNFLRSQLRSRYGMQ